MSTSKKPSQLREQAGEFMRAAVAYVKQATPQQQFITGSVFALIGVLAAVSAHDNLTWLTIRLQASWGEQNTQLLAWGIAVTASLIFTLIAAVVFMLALVASQNLSDEDRQEVAQAAQIKSAAYKRLVTRKHGKKKQVEEAEELEEQVNLEE